MVTFAEAFQHWTDFPKGLQVLVVDTDTQFLRDIARKLESYQYFVTSLSSGEEACVALASHTQTFHVALVEANESNGVDSCKILSYAKDVPTIVMSMMENMSMMVKSIALGAVEFLLKPLTEDKLKNIWQHVVRKALDSPRDSLRPRYLEPGKPTISLLLLREDHEACSEDGSNISNVEKSQHESIGASQSLMLSVACEKFAAPSTPQLEQSGRMALQDGIPDESPRSHGSSEVCNYKERINVQNDADNLSCSTVSKDVKEEAKDILDVLPDTVIVKEEEEAVDQQAQIFFCTIPMLASALQIEDVGTVQTNDTKLLESGINEQDEGFVPKDTNCDFGVTTEVCEMSSTEGYELQDARNSTMSHSDTSKDSAECRNTDSTCQSETIEQHHGKDGSKGEGKKKSSDSENEGKNGKCSKKKFKVDWTADLHRRFVQAVEFLGVEQAIPSRILEVMKVDGLTRHNVASHLQKYRSHKKHIHAREVEASTWHQNKLSCGRPWSHARQNVHPPMWIQPRPPVFCQPLHVWGHPRVDNPAMHAMPQYMMGSNGWPVAWGQPMADSWVPGVPSMVPCYVPHTNITNSGYPQRKGLRNPTCGSFPEDAENSSFEATNSSSKSRLQELYPPKELLDAAISEALSNPWMPLPLGLKPPSMESVMAELQRQGIDALSSLS